MATLTETRFTTFWRGCNAALKANGLPGIGAARARDYWLMDRELDEHMAGPVPVRGTAALSLIERAVRATGEIA